MIEGTSKLYKLMVLYMLSKVKHHISNNKIVDFFTSGEYANYFTVQEVLNSLEEDDFITCAEKQNISLYTLTERGELAVDKFKEDIADSFRDDIDRFISENKYELKNDVSVTSEYFQNKYGEYTVICKVKEKLSTIIDLSISVPLEENAKSICANWNKKSSDVYKHIIKTLLT